MNPSRTDVRSVRCPDCGSLPNFKCRNTVTQKIRESNHQGRLNNYKTQQGVYRARTPVMEHNMRTTARLLFYINNTVHGFGTDFAVVEAKWFVAKWIKESGYLLPDETLAGCSTQFLFDLATNILYAKMKSVDVWEELT